MTISRIVSRAALACFCLLGHLAAASIELMEPAVGAVVEQLNEARKAFIDKPQPGRIPFFRQEEESKYLRTAGYLPGPVKLRWRWNGGGEPEFEVAYSENEDLSDARKARSRVPKRKSQI